MFRRLAPLKSQFRRDHRWRRYREIGRYKAHIFTLIVEPWFLTTGSVIAVSSYDEGLPWTFLRPPKQLFIGGKRRKFVDYSSVTFIRSTGSTRRYFVSR